VAQFANLFWDKAAGFETHELASGLIALFMSIDVLALMRASGEEFEGFEEALHAELRHEDQATGAGFAAVVPTLWAVQANRFLGQHNQGQAVAVMGGVVRNTVTGYVAARACRLVAAAMQAPAPRIFFALAEDYIESHELAHNLHFHGALKYTHTAVCAPEGCPDPYGALLVSSYSSDALADRDADLGAVGSAMLYAEEQLRAMLRLTDKVVATDAYACPAHMVTAAINVQSTHRLRHCVACADGLYYDAGAMQCAECTAIPGCSSAITRGMSLHNCSWSADAHCARARAVAAP